MSSVMLYFAVGWVVPDIARQYTPFTFRSQEVQDINPSWTTWPLKMKAPWSFETSGTTQHSVTSQTTWILSNTAILLVASRRLSLIHLQVKANMKKSLTLLEMQSLSSHDHSENQQWCVESVPCLRNRALIWLWYRNLNFLNQICVVSFSIPFYGNVSYSLYQFCLHLQNITTCYTTTDNLQLTQFQVTQFWNKYNKFAIITF